MDRKQRDKATNAIAIGRIAVGASAWLTPNLSGRLFGLDPEGNPQLPYRRPPVRRTRRGARSRA